MKLKTYAKGLQELAKLYPNFEVKFKGNIIAYAYPDIKAKVIRLLMAKELPPETALAPEDDKPVELVDGQGNYILF